MVLLGSLFITIGKYIGITDPVLAVNLIGVIFGSTAVWALYLLTFKISNNIFTAISASLLLLLNPIFLDSSTYGINHAPALCFLLLGLWQLLCFQGSNDKRHLVFSALFLGFMGATRLQDFIFTFPSVASLFILGIGPQASPKTKTPVFFLFSAMIISTIIIFHLPYFLSHDTPYLLQAKSFWKIGLSNNFQGLFSRSLIMTFGYLLKAFSLLGLLCSCVGLGNTARTDKRLFIFLILWITPPLGFYGNTATSVPRFLNIILPAFIIPLSILLTSNLKHKWMVWRLLAMLSFLIILFVPLQNTYQTFLRRHHDALIPDYYRWVGLSTKADAQILSADDALFITYYSGRKAYLKPLAMANGHLPVQDLNDFKIKLDDTLKKHQPVYATNSAIVLYDPHREFENFLRQNYHLVTIGQKPLELWYLSPFNPQFHISNLLKIERK